MVYRLVQYDISARSEYHMGSIIVLYRLVQVDMSLGYPCVSKRCYIGWLCLLYWPVETAMSVGSI